MHACMQSAGARTRGVSLGVSTGIYRQLAILLRAMMQSSQLESELSIRVSFHAETLISCALDQAVSL